MVRRFSDFEWLHGEICCTYPGVVIPILPEKTLVFAGISTTSTGFDVIDDRRYQFEIYLRQLIHGHTTAEDNFKDFPILIFFLTASEDDMKARNYQQLGYNRTMSTMSDVGTSSQNYKTLQSSVENRQSSIPSRVSWMSNFSFMVSKV